MFDDDLRETFTELTDRWVHDLADLVCLQNPTKNFIIRINPTDCIFNYIFLAVVFKFFQ